MICGAGVAESLAIGTQHLATEKSGDVSRSVPPELFREHFQYKTLWNAIHETCMESRFVPRRMKRDFPRDKHVAE